MEIVGYENRYAVEISEIVIRNLMEVNIADYGLEEMEEMSGRFQPEDITKLAKVRHTFVAIEENQVLATGSISNDFSEDKSDYWVLTVFVNPDLHGQGIGRMMMQTLETKAMALGCKHLTLPSSLTSHKFYLKLGYNYIGGVAIQNDKRQYMMEKIL